MEESKNAKSVTQEKVEQNEVKPEKVKNVQAPEDATSNSKPNLKVISNFFALPTYNYQN